LGIVIWQRQEQNRRCSAQDCNGYPENDCGVSPHAKVNEHGIFHFLVVSGPRVVSPANKYYYFITSMPTP
jgi:hypothetical protein